MIILPDFRVRQRDFLLKISRAITAQLDLDEVLRLVLEASVSMLNGELGLIALRDADDRLQVRAVHGVDEDQIESFDVILRLIAENETADVDQDQLKMRIRLLARRLDMNLRQVVSLPMRISGEMLGIVLVFRTFPGSPTPDDHMILQSFADQAAIAVHNAGLYQAIIAEKQRLSAILDGSGDGILILDAHGRVMRLNPAISRMTGWKPEYALGRFHDDIIRWMNTPPEMALEQAMARGWPYNFFPHEDDNDGEGGGEIDRTLYVEGDIERLDGLTLSVGITYAPLFFDDGSLRNIIANVRDVTRAREAEKMKSTFISVISHELKTPVALIKGYAGTLSREDAEWDKATIRRGLTVIEEEADRLTTLIDNLLVASRLQAEGAMHLDIAEVVLDDLVAESVERFRTQTDDHAFSIDFPEDFPPCRGDYRRLRQVMDNLISNAIKYSPEGGEIIIQGEFDESQVKISVADQGIGLTEEETRQVFERFFRSPQAVKGGMPGTGLGLYLAKAVIDAHGGRISVTSTPGKGTTFTFTLPCTITVPQD
jgi:signal transduction histidine kinase